ncbi:hypothetical protein [Sulfurovum sp. TSL1]|uniref:hypothetical protein n=1 Tax=Sulfurovum sp. TSL1 TaxID=2826994 RepID=UPI001CC75FD0|nr:hypothetical protein [Sulfurovum sp. TSL1]GIT97357.1 hypothetical protein TSL1_01780 [Sulfurovum sp. TSL1]
MHHFVVRFLKFIVLIGMVGSVMYAKEAVVPEAFVKSAADLIEKSCNNRFRCTIVKITFL